MELLAGVARGGGMQCVHGGRAGGWPARGSSAGQHAAHCAPQRASPLGDEEGALAQVLGGRNQLHALKGGQHRLLLVQGRAAAGRRLHRLQANVLGSRHRAKQGQAGAANERVMRAGPAIAAQEPGGPCCAWAASSPGREK